MSSAERHLRLPVATLLSLVVLGCAAGGQTGEESTLACKETRAPLELEEDSPLGFGAEEVLAVASAERAALEWLDTDPAYGPESGASELSVSLVPRGSAAFVTSRAPDGREAFPCLDRVEVDVAVTLGTTGGALSESFDGALRATEATEVTLSHVFENGDVNGALAFDEASLAGRRVTRVTFDSRFGDGAISGALSAGIEQRFGSDSDGTVSFQDLTIACFGEITDRCPGR